MEARAKDLMNEATDMAERAKETAQDWKERAKSAGSAAIGNAKSAYNLAQSKAVAGARATDTAIRDNPYQTIGIAFGVGLLIGFLINRK